MIANPAVGSGSDQNRDDPLMGNVAATEDDCLEQCSPPEPVDVVDVNAGGEQPAHDALEAAVCGTNQPGPTICVHRPHIGTMGQQELEESGVVADLGGGDEIGTLLRAVLMVDVRPGSHECRRDLDMIAVCRMNQGRRTAVVSAAH